MFAQTAEQLLILGTSAEPVDSPASLLRPDSRNNVTQASFETGKEPATPSLESVADVGIVKILRIAVEEAALRRMVKIQVREHGCKNDGILTRHAEFRLYLCG